MSSSCPHQALSAETTIRASMKRKSTDSPSSSHHGSSQRAKAARTSGGGRGNIFISKHEHLGKHIAENVARELQARGYEVWFSQWQRNRDEAEMQRGVDHCDALVVIMTPGIFEWARHWVTHTEVKYAIDSGKPIILIDGGFKFEKQSTCQNEHPCLKEFANTREDFQPYARAMVRALEVIEWKGNRIWRRASLEIFEEKFEDRHSNSQKLQERLIKEKAVGACSCCNTLEEVELPEKWRKIVEPLPLAAPKLCEHFQDRPELLSGILQEINTSGGSMALVGVRGQGGVGKSEALKWLARHEDIHSHFSTVVWIQAGQDTTELDILHQLARHVFQIDFEVNFDAAKRYLEERFTAFGSRKMIVFVDDVWKHEQADIINHLTRLAGSQVVVFSSRFKEVLPSSTAIKDVNVLDSETACKLLVTHASRGETPDVKRIAELCGHVPVALKVVGKMGIKRDWSVVLAKLERDATKVIKGNDRGGYGDVALAFTSSLSYLKEEDAELYEKYLLLSVLPEDFEVKVDALRVLFGEVDEGDTEEWLQSLADKSLLEIRKYHPFLFDGFAQGKFRISHPLSFVEFAQSKFRTGNFVWLHNLQHVFLRKKGFEWIFQSEAHQERAANGILAAARCTGLSDGPKILSSKASIKLQENQGYAEKVRKLRLDHVAFPRIEWIRG